MPLDTNGFEVVTDSPPTKDTNGFEVVAHPGHDANGFEVVHPGGIQKMNQTPGMTGSEAPVEELGVLGGVQDVLENTFAPAFRALFQKRDITGMPVLQKPAFQIPIMYGPNAIPGQTNITQGPPQLNQFPQAYQPMIQPPPVGYDEQGNAQYAPLNRLLMGASTPGNAGVLPFAAGEGALARALSGYFAAQGGVGTYEAGKTMLDPSATPEARHQAVEDLPLNLAMLGGGTRHALHEARLAPQPNFPDARTAHPVEGDEVGSYQQILSRIAANKDSQFSALAQQWLEAGRDTELMNKKVTVDPNLNRAGAYDPKNGATVHPDFTDNDFVMLHEIGHGLTEARLNNPELNGMLNTLYDVAKQSMGEEGAKLHGMENVDEFTTETLTNPSFRQSLKFTRAGDRSVLDRFIDLAMSAVGRAREKGSLLEKVRAEADKLVDGKGPDLQIPEKSTSPWNDEKPYTPPAQPGFYAGPGGVAQAPLRPQDEYDVQQQPQRKLLGYEPPPMQGPEAPPEPSKFVAGYTGTAKEDMSPQERYQVGQPRPTRGLLGYEPPQIQGPEAPEEPGRFVAGPRGTAQEPMSPQERYQVEQPREVKGLIGDASYKFGPTTVRQTLANVEAQLKGEPVEKPLPGTKRVGDQAKLDEAKRVGDTIGFTFKPSGVLTGDVPPEMAKQLPKPQWEFTDRKKGSATEGLTFYVPEGSGQAEIVKARDAKLDAIAEAAKDKGKLSSGVQLPDQDLNDFSLTASRLLRNPDKLKFHTQTGDVDGGQLVNRLMNLVPPAEKDLLEKQGIREQFPAGKKTNLKDVDKWVQENGPKTEVKVLKSGSKNSDGSELQGDVDERRERELQHQLETLGYEPDVQYDNVSISKDGNEIMPRADKYDEDNIALEDLPKEHQDLIQEWGRLAGDRTNNVNDPREHAGFDPDTYRSIAPKDKDQTVVMVRVPVKDIQSKNQLDDGRSIGTYKEQPLHRGNHFGSEDRNVLGWARVQYEDVGGKKVAHVIEVQSDWGQKVREAKEELKRAQERGSTSTKTGENEHPLLRDYNRLVLKAAIDQARKDGASHIALSDAETAMMSEGHDLQDPRYRLVDDKGEAFQTGLTSMARAKSQLEKIGKPGDQIVREPFPQEKGMTLNYSKILPDIMEKLTGNKGEKVSFGEHQRAFEKRERLADGRFMDETEDPEALQQNWEAVNAPRKNLIFKNPDGTPKTDASGLLYDLGKVKEARETKPYTYFGKDEPEKLFSGVPLKDKVEKTFKDFKAHVINREQAAQSLDAADNVARVNGRQKGNRVSVALPDKLDRQALTFVVESGGDKTKLQEYAKQVAGKNKTAEAAIARAQSDLARLKPHADQVSQWIEEQRQAEVAKGIQADYLTNYMKHAYDMEDTGFFNSGPGGNGVSTSFLKPRTFPDYATAIENGFKPRNLDAAKLLESRVSAGQKLMNREAWGEGLKQLKTTSGAPLAADLVKDKGRLLAPEGYERMELSPGNYMAINKEYKDLIGALTGTSFVRESKLGRGLLKTGAVIKHNMLAFDLYHASRMMRREFFLNGRVGYEKGVSLLEYDKPTVQRLVAKGEIKPEMAQWIEKNRPTADLLLKKGLNVGRLTDALFAEIVSKPLNIKGKDYNIIGHTQRWVFDKLTRGAMLESAMTELEKTKKQNPTWTPEQAASHTAKQMNIYYGNLSRQGVFKSESFRDMMQVAFLAPQWVESMTQSEARGYKQIGQAGVDAVAKRRLQVGSLGKGMTAGVVASLVAAQIVNLGTTGKPTWKNDEGHKLDAKLPGGYYVSPLNDMAEMTHDYLKYGEKGKTALETTSQIAGNKLSPIARAAKTLTTGRDYADNKLSDHDRIKETVKALDPRPLFISGLGSEVPKQAGKQAYSLLGLKVEPDFRMHEEALEKQSGKKFDDMTLEDRLIAERQVDSERGIGDDKAKLRATERGMELQAQRGQEMTKAMDKADRGWLESRGLQLPGYDSKVVFTKADTGFDKPTSVYLTKTEMKRYGEIMQEHYKAAVDLMREDYDKMEDNESKKDYYASVMKEVRSLAREQMKMEMSGSKNESDKEGKE